ncbi:uncharacterized protein [Rutidosis leptorrhynchoides]|uniref:uncharacterized protein n=1 Tax=Rutidosis leptorrhynchoides TaxID=125765 RepID=UPI003A9A37E8
MSKVVREVEPEVVPEVVPFTPLNMIIQERRDWKVRVKVLDQWKKTWLGKPDSILSYEFILADFQGNKIRASIFKNYMDFFAHSFKEGCYVDLSNFEVKVHDDEYKLVDHEFKISMLKKRVVKRCQPFKILRDVHNFLTFKDVNQGLVPKESLVKVINIKVDKESEDDKKSINFELADISGERVRCKLWGSYAENLYRSLSINYKKDTDVLLMLHNCRMKDWEGPQINNQLWGFKFFLNDSVEPILDFKEALANAIQSSVNYVKSVVEIDLGRMRHRGFLNSFNDSEGWFQYYCNNCDKNKVVRVFDVDERKFVYNCRVYRITSDDANKKIRASIYVQDKTGGGELALFDGQLSKMIHRSVQWLKNTAKITVDLTDYPIEFNRVLMKKFVFIVKHKLYGEESKLSGYTVYDLTDNADVLKKLDAILAAREAQYKDFDEHLTQPDSPDVKQETPCSTSQTPGSNGNKRKIPTPSSSADNETPTGGTTAALSDLKIPKMEKL